MNQTKTYQKGDHMDSEGMKAITLCSVALILGTLTVNGSIFEFVGWIWAGFSYFITSFLS